MAKNVGPIRGGKQPLVETDKGSHVEIHDLDRKSCPPEDGEPMGDDLRGSSLQVPVGADHVPGLAKALAAAMGSGSARG